MEQRTSRLERDMLEWQHTEQRYIKMFGERIIGTRKHLQEKLAHFEVMEIKYRGTQNRWEQMDLRYIRDERRKVERQLYPNFLTRLLYRTAKRILDNPAVSRYQRANHQNVQELKEFVSKKGFGSILKQLDQQLAKGQNEFSIPVSYQVSENERMEFRLNFTREPTGNYLVDDIKASLVKENDPTFKGTISIIKNDLDSVTAHQAYNLLSGRYVEQEGNWIALDFNDKDAAGNFRTKLYPPGYGFDLENVFEQLACADQLSFLEKKEIMQNLRNGDKQYIGPSEKKVELQVNVQKKAISPAVSAGVSRQAKTRRVISFSEKENVADKKRMKLS